MDTLLATDDRYFLVSPPPPPESLPVFQSMFSSKKSKKSHSVPIRLPSEIRPVIKASKSQAQSLLLNSHKLQFPSDKINEIDEITNSGSELPLFQIPKLPPLPPFKMPEWKFQVEGYFVRIKSCKTMLEQRRNWKRAKGPENLHTGKDGTKTPTICLRPDVNSKADGFIAMFRAGLQLEKMNMNSFNQKQGRRRSNLERNPDPEQ